MKLVREVGVTHLLVQIDSQLITSQVKGEFQTHDPSLLKYLQKALKMSQTFEEFKINHILRGENTRADLLAQLESTKGTRLNKTVIQETLEMRSTKVEEVMTLNEARGWMMPIIRYLSQNEISKEEIEAKHIL